MIKIKPNIVDNKNKYLTPHAYPRLTSKPSTQMHNRPKISAKIFAPFDKLSLEKKKLIIPSPTVANIRLEALMKFECTCSFIVLYSLDGYLFCPIIASLSMCRF